NIAKAGQDIAAILARRLGNTALLGDWDGIETHEPGDHVILYHFTYQRFDNDAASQGALLVFSRGNLVSVVGVIGNDNYVAADAVRLARVMDYRAQQALAASSS